MKRWIQTGSLLMLFIIIFQACEEWDLAEEDFISVEFNSLDVLSLNSVKLTGEIKDLKIGQISDHGFLWTTKQTIPSFYNNEGIHSLGIKDKEDNPSFSAEVEDLDPDTRYIFVAFTILEGDVFHSEPMNWESGKGMAYTDSLVYNGSRSLTIFGRMSGTEAGIIGVNHGFCWSAQNETPSLGDEFVDLGNQRSDLPFFAEVGGLENQVALYFRAYAVLRHPTTFALDTVYGEVLNFDGNLYDFWTQRANFGGDDRENTVSFSINDKGYFGTGNLGGTYFKDFWEYDPQADAWTQKADFGGEGRAWAAEFSINDKGYIGTGYGGGSNSLKDFWEYEPQTDSWNQKADFVNNVNAKAGFSINEKGYLQGNFGSFWEYWPQTDSWTQRADFEGVDRQSAVGFSINDKGYIGTGNGAGSILRDFWEYDTQTDAWTQKADFGGEAREYAVGFSLNDKGYVGTGSNENGIFLKDFWEYDPQTDSWVDVVDFGAGGRQKAIGFSINDKGYIGVGIAAGGIVKDLWEYTPQ